MFVIFIDKINYKDFDWGYLENVSAVMGALVHLSNLKEEETTIPMPRLGDLLDYLRSRLDNLSIANKERGRTNILRSGFKAQLFLALILLSRPGSPVNFHNYPKGFAKPIFKMYSKYMLRI
jgi:hypothetical protein